MKGIFRIYPGALRYEFSYVKADSFSGKMRQGRDEISDCGV